ncbi:tripartite tricarboxylate transporter permease [Candidatus Pacearchaeota archaeon]|nr:tripartite tricarboxylate transporter permease [Candidatus Pacearchaeota archaeon]
MLIEILLFILVGIGGGVVTGLFPGIHINLVGAILLIFVEKGSSINPLFIVVLIISMSITHVFVDFIPSILLGAPEEGTELSVLPGYELLKKGLGLQAISLTSLGCLYGTFILILLFPIFYFITFPIYNFLKPGVAILLLIACAFLIFSDEKKIGALIVFLISGMLGFIVLNLNLNESLLPMLGGLFGASTLILSIKTKTTIPKQEEVGSLKIKKFKSVIAATLISPISIFLPAIGSGQIATIGNQIAQEEKQGFLFLLGIVNILTLGFSFLALSTISKTRTGVSVVVKELIGIPSWKLLGLILITIILSGIISFLITKVLSKKFIKILEKVEYQKLSIITLIIISIIVLIFSGIVGFLIFIISTATGIYCISLNVRRTQMMGCLLVPTIILYLF